MTKTGMLLAAAVLAAASGAASAEDLTLVFKTTGKQGASTATSYYSTEKMRTGDAENETIVEYGPGKIIAIDHRKKEYSEITLAEMEVAMKQLAAKMEEANKQMEQQMASMPPAMREKMQQMMGGAAGSVSVTKGGTRQVAGYSCQDYSIAMGETMTTRLCATTALAPAGDFKRFASFASSMGAMAQNPMFKGMSKMADELKKIEGLTIAEATSVKIMGKSMDTSKEAVEIKKGPIPAAALDVAAIAKGYKKIAHPMTKMK